MAMLTGDDGSTEMTVL